MRSLPLATRLAFDVCVRNSRPYFGAELQLSLNRKRVKIKANKNKTGGDRFAVTTAIRHTAAVATAFHNIGGGNDRFPAYER